MACAVVLAGCRQSAEMHREEGHAHLMLTAYSASYEFFAEAHPFAVGEASRVNVHLTRLSDFKPADGISVQLSLPQGESAGGVVEDGRVALEITPAAAGASVLRVVADGETLELPVTVYADEEAAHEAAEAAERHSSNAAAFSKEQSWKVDFATQELHAGPADLVIRTVGRVGPAQSQQQAVVARSAGVVQLAATLVAGSPVVKGRPLFSIKSGGVVVDGNLDIRYEQARSEYERTKSEYERKQQLAGDRIVSASELGIARSEYEKAAAVFETVSKSYTKGGSTISAPLTGYVVSLNVGNGQYVEPGTVLATVASSSRLQIEAGVPTRWQSSLSSLYDAAVCPAGAEEGFLLSGLGGRIVSVGQAATAASPLIPVVLEVDGGRAGLVGGSFADVALKCRVPGERISVPDAAVVEEMGNYFVYVQLTPEYFEKTPVVPGGSDGMNTVILEGLEEGCRVVTCGAVLIRLAQAAGALDPHAGHVH